MSSPSVTRTAQVVVASADDNLVELPSFSSGRLSRVMVVQLDGTLAGFTADIYDRRDAVPGEAVESIGPDDLVEHAVSPLSHRVIPQISAAALAASAGVDEKFAQYKNRDEIDPNQNLPTYMLYMNLRPSGSGSKTFEVTWTVTRDS